MKTIYPTSFAITTSFWESPSLIPVLLMLVKEHLHQWEKQPYSLVEKSSPPALSSHSQQMISQYLALCQHWKQTPLNDRQRQWLQEIECCLQNYAP